MELESLVLCIIRSNRRCDGENSHWHNILDLCCLTNYKLKWFENHDFGNRYVICQEKRSALKVWSTFILLTYGWLRSSLFYANQGPSFVWEAGGLLSWLFSWITCLNSVYMFWRTFREVKEDGILQNSNNLITSSPITWTFVYIGQSGYCHWSNFGA